MSTNKFVVVLKSRKFWAAIISLLVVFGFLPDSDHSALIEAISTVSIAVSYIVATAYEDANRGRV